MKWPNSFYTPQNFIKIQTNLDHFRYAGKITAKCLSMLEQAVLQKTTKSLLELDALAEEFFLDNKTHPVFKNYHGFPNTVCISVNKQLVHGIPTDYRLQDGDVVTFDTGCNFKGAIADSALTCIFGQPKDRQHVELVSATKEALYAGIRKVLTKNRVGAIGNAIFHSARKNGFKVIETYSGHGISLDHVHSDPLIPNKSDENFGIRLKPGMVIAIEPLLVLGNSTKTTVDDDRWTVWANDICSHFEHSVIVNDSGPEIITLREKEVNI